MKQKSSLLVISIIVIIVLAIIVYYIYQNRGVTLPPSTPIAPTVTEHPRLFFTEADIPTLRQQAATTHNEIWQPILEYVNTRVGESPPQYTVAIEEQHWRELGNELIAFTFVCVITDEDDYCDLALSHLLSFARWERWDDEGVRDLGLAHMLMGNAIAYDWLFTYMTEDERLLVRQQLAHKTQQMYLASAGERRDEWGNWWRLSYIQNHYWTNNNALGVAALALANDAIEAGCRIRTSEDVNLYDSPNFNSEILSTVPSNTMLFATNELVGEDNELWWQLRDDAWILQSMTQTTDVCDNVIAGAEEWLNHAVRQLEVSQYMLEGIEDGTWHEGIHYQGYMLTMFLPFAINVRELSDVDLLADDYMQNYVNFRIYNFIPDTHEPLLSYGNFEIDWGNAYAPQNILRFLAAEYDNGYAEWMAQELISVERIPNRRRVPWYVFEFLYYDPSIESEAPGEDFAQSAYFPDLEGIVWRTGWGEESIAFALKTGAVGGQFAYDTFTNFEFPWDTPCVEVGCQFNIGHNHDNTNTFYLTWGNTWLIPEHVSYDAYESLFHNVILIDGQGQHRPSSENGWRDPAIFENTAGHIEILANTQDFDYLVSDATSRYPDQGLDSMTRHVLFIRPNYFIMVDNIAAQEPHIYQWLVHVSESMSVEGNWIRSDASDERTLGIAVLAPEDYSIETDMETNNYARLSIQPTDPVEDIRFIHALYPTASSNWESRPSIELLTDTGSRIAMQVDRTNVDNIVDDILINYGESGLGYDGYYDYDGHVATISRDVDGNIVRLFTVGGTRLSTSDNNEDYIIRLDANQSELQLTFDNDIVYLSGNYTGTVSLYSPSTVEILREGNSIEYQREGDYIYFDTTSLGN